MTKWLITVEVISLLCLSSLSYADIYGVKIDHKHRFELLTDDNNVNDLAYFLTAISTDKKHIWVNLEKTRPDKVISRELSNTKLGNTLLYADHKLKRKLIKYSSGTEYDKITRTYRNGIFGGLDYVWVSNTEITIVPKYAKVVVDNGVVVIDSLSLTVEMRGGNYQDEYSGRTNHPLVREIDLSLHREHTLPKLIRDVNYHGDFKELRTAYKAIVLAEWYKKHFGLSKSLETNDSQLEMNVYSNLIFNEFSKQEMDFDFIYSKDNGLTEEFYVSGGFTAKLLSIKERMAEIVIRSIDVARSIKVLVVDEKVPEWMRNMFELSGYYTHKVKGAIDNILSDPVTIKMLMAGVDFSELEVVE